MPVDPYLYTPESRRMVLKINLDQFIGIGKREVATVGKPIPDDAIVVGRRINERGDLELLIQSPEFPATAEGCPYPSLDLTLRDL